MENAIALDRTNKVAWTFLLDARQKLAEENKPTPPKPRPDPPSEPF